MKLSLLLLALTLALFFTQTSRGEEVLDNHVRDSLVGTWELVAVVEHGKDVTEDLGVTRNEKLLVYVFEDDGSFSITAGGVWFESGTWKIDTKTLPMRFDHTPTEAPNDPEIIGEESLGIFEIGGGIVKMCVADDPPDIRPKTFDTSSCILFIMRSRS